MSGPRGRGITRRWSGSRCIGIYFTGGRASRVRRRGRSTALRHPAMADPTKKPFRLRADQIKPIATGYGGCIATDMITCGGRKVAFMYREATERDLDSG